MIKRSIGCGLSGSGHGNKVCLAGKTVIAGRPPPDVLRERYGAAPSTMFFYDGLLMPVRYWAPMPDEESWLARRRWYRLFGTGQDPRRPPSSAATVMFHGIQRVWSALFVPAAVAAGLGTGATAVALAKPEGGWWYALIASALGVASVLALLALAGRPQLGTTD